MDLDDYQSAAMRTAKGTDEEISLIHAALGLTGEAGEFADIIKRRMIYRQSFDEQGAVEEIGDILWYCAFAAQALHRSLSEIAESNIDKLRRRYPEHYTDRLAADRLDKR